MKRSLATVLALVLVLSCLPLTALAYSWYCPWCGQHNTKYETICENLSCDYSLSKEPSTWTCPECGFYNTEYMYICGGPRCIFERTTETLYPTPSSSSSKRTSTITSSLSLSTLKISSVYRSSSTGYVNVSWNDSNNNSPYTVTYYQGGNSWATWNESAGYGVYSKSCSLKGLCPGSTYTITVKDSKGNTASYTYSENGVKDFKDFNMSVNLQLKSRKSGNTKNLSSFNISHIENRPAYEWGYYVRLDHKKLSYDRTHNVLFVIKDPDGFVISRSWVDNCTFESRYSGTYWEFIDMSDAFDRVGNKYGFIPSGEYRFIVYLDGERVGRKSFKVGY